VNPTGLTPTEWREARRLSEEGRWPAASICLHFQNRTTPAVVYMQKSRGWPIAARADAAVREHRLPDPPRPTPTVAALPTCANPRCGLPLRPGQEICPRCGWKHGEVRVWRAEESGSGAGDGTARKVQSA
jgi:hypothetical protein